MKARAEVQAHELRDYLKIVELLFERQHFTEFSLIRKLKTDGKG